MKTMVIYNSQTGFTKRYAKWIAEATGARYLELSVAKRRNLDDYDAIVFGSWACAGGVSKLGWFKGNIDKWADKKLVMFCVGAGPVAVPDVEKTLKESFDGTKVSVFYCPGGLNYDIMPTPSKLAMKTLLKVLSAKKNKTEDDKAMISMIAKSYDISDKKYIEPILECLEAQEDDNQE